MPADLEGALRHATVLTFEELAFALPAGDGGAVAAKTVSAQVAFHGPFAGRVVLTVDEAMLPTLAANMLGVEEPPPAADQKDALGELANVLCGNLLPAIAGTEHVFLLDAPAPGEDGGAPTAAVTLALDVGTARASLYCDPAP
jgi:CheY-specific phosphatase CheX